MDLTVRLIEEDGYLWIEFPDDAWRRAEFVEWTEGIEWFVKRY